MKEQVPEQWSTLTTIFCIAQVAKGLGKDSLYLKYIQRSNNWKNLWKSISHLGSTGFVMPRKSNGQWDNHYKDGSYTYNYILKKFEEDDHFNTLSYGTWPDFFYEGRAWEYSLYVPQDVEGLIKMSGGKEAFEKRLDTYFGNGFYNVINEPSFFTPCLYTYIGKSWKTNDIIRSVVKKKYSDTRGGLPGNDDAGSMSAWFIFNTIGFFPNAGQDIYIITAPAYDEVIMKLSDSKKLIIKTINLSEKNKYISSVKLNGKILNRAWLTHHEIIEGGIIEFKMSSIPGQGGQKLPPPSSTVPYSNK